MMELAECRFVARGHRDGEKQAASTDARKVQATGLPITSRYDLRRGNKRA